MQLVAIVNPISGAGMDPRVAGRRVALIRDELRRRRLDSAIHLTEREGHARELAARAAEDRADLVIVWGGDGTANEVGAGLMSSGTTMALIPAGSGNGLAAALGVPRDPRAALATALGERTMAIDVGMINGSPFFNVAGVGFDAHVAHLFNKRAQGRRGRLPYVVIGVREGCRYVAKTYAVTLDGSRIESKALLIVFANGREFGSGAQIAPQAKLDDGLLDASIIEDRPVVSRFLHARHLAFGSIERAPRIIRRPVQSAMVEADGTIAYHLDGEPRLAEGRLEVAIKPGALVVKV